jgi:hypothetical protein
VPPQFFTVAEAREALPEVRRQAERLVASRAEQLAAAARLAEVTGVSAGNGHGPEKALLAELRGALEGAETELAAAFRALDELGVVVKDVDAGLVDFPSKRAGEDVFLCWQVGEPDLSWWHGVDEGFAGRKPI